MPSPGPVRFNRLSEYGLPVIAMNVGETHLMSEPDRFVRLRDELAFRVREWFMAGDYRCARPVF